MISSLLSLYIASTISPDFTKTVENSYGKTEISGLLNMSAGPTKKKEFISPIIQAEGSIAIDLESNNTLYEKNAHERLAIASLTKLMTTLIVLEENKMNELVIISNNAASTEGSTMYLHAGEEMSVESLLYGTIIQSANDGAVALAEHNAGSVDQFVTKMNKKASSLGLLNTNFTNPTGLDSANNYSSAYDVAKLAKKVYEHPLIRDIAKLKEFTVKSNSGKFTHKLTSTNQLLDSFLNIKGLKTGSTLAAGECLTAIAENKNGKEILTVVLHSPDRFRESKILIDWIFRAYNW
jgi:D-alanyl-D-alanine carboxypeptidase (penicillin-binding protein 5/6)